MDDDNWFCDCDCICVYMWYVINDCLIIFFLCWMGIRECDVFCDGDDFIDCIK